MGNPLTGAGWSIANREKLKLADETPLTNPMSPRTIGYIISEKVNNTNNNSRSFNRDSVKRLRDSFIIKSEVTNLKSPRGMIGLQQQQNLFINSHIKEI
jgi:hypothetical protein